jgi:hypothetical protein
MTVRDQPARVLQTYVRVALKTNVRANNRGL